VLLLTYNYLCLFIILNWSDLHVNKYALFLTIKQGVEGSSIGRLQRGVVAEVGSGRKVSDGGGRGVGKWPCRRLHDLLTIFYFYLFSLRTHNWLINISYSRYRADTGVKWMELIVNAKRLHLCAAVLSADLREWQLNSQAAGLRRETQDASQDARMTCVSNCYIDCCAHDRHDCLCIIGVGYKRSIKFCLQWVVGGI